MFILAIDLLPRVVKKFIRGEWHFEAQHAPCFAHVGNVATNSMADATYFQKGTGLFWGIVGLIGTIISLRNILSTINGPSSLFRAKFVLPTLIALLFSFTLILAGYGSYKSKSWGRVLMLIILPCILLWIADVTLFCLWQGGIDWFFYVLLALGFFALLSFLGYLRR